MQASPALVRDLTTLFREKLFIDVPSADTDLIESGLMDSLQLVQLVLHVERELGYRIPLDEIDLDDLRSLARLARVISQKAELARAA
jgi:acyl carrier protein